MGMEQPQLMQPGWTETASVTQPWNVPEMQQRPCDQSWGMEMGVTNEYNKSGSELPTGKQRTMDVITLGGEKSMGYNKGKSREQPSRGKETRKKGEMERDIWMREQLGKDGKNAGGKEMMAKPYQNREQSLEEL